MIEPDKLFNKAMEQAEMWADDDYTAGILEDALSTLEGILIAELKANGEPITIIPKLLKKDPRWIDSSNRWRDAKKSALLSKLKYDQVCRYMDNVRTKETTERALAR